MGNWKTEDEDGFNYQDFFNNIIELFRDDNGRDLENSPWVKDTLSWWNKYVCICFLTILHLLILILACH